MGSAADAERDIIPCRRIPSNAKVRQLTAGATLSASRYVSTAEETWQLGITQISIKAVKIPIFRLAPSLALSGLTAS